jgi:hypothetical protein
MRRRYYAGTRDTRWDVYPHRGPVVAVAYDGDHVYTADARGEWCKAPMYNLGAEVTERDAAIAIAVALLARGLLLLAGASLDGGGRVRQPWDTDRTYLYRLSGNGVGR